MKRIVAIIKQFKLGEVREGLLAAGLPGITVTEARGFGRQMGHTELYRGAQYFIEFVSKVMIEMVVNDDQVDEAVRAVRAAAQTAHIGDGKIFITHIELAVRIRTGEAGAGAL